ncbi:MAG: type I DNA topoisomerase, partial [Candidatus Omnitrophica bacterium]|nr:type I DNA topoisomerase [Candidatus Omnitrophota bacterium]
CRTIEKILGKDYSVQASMGHIIDLPKSKMGVDLENNFDPQYIVMVQKRKTLTHLKKYAAGAENLFLACDPDREGEAICWHLGRELGKDKNVYRVTFQEITSKAIRAAFEKPVEINMNKVGAQQARRILDRIVGYSLSPLLWQSVAKGLSAGRVQSVALRLIIDQERKIKAFEPHEYWTLDAVLKKSNGESFSASLDKSGDEKIEINDEDTAHRISEELKGQNFEIQTVKSTEKRRMPQPPFTTSKLQQESFNKLRMRPAKTMSVAQSLYEGVDVGGGETAGLITYMRTDSVAISDSALEEVRSFIQSEYGPDELPGTPNKFKAKKSAQEAHEAIRPTSVSRTPDAMSSFLTDDQLKLYRLIWMRFVASQMLPAVMEQTSAQIQAGRFILKASGSRILKAGFLTVLDDSAEDDTKRLPELNEGEKLELESLAENQHFTKPPPRFTDASLVKTLEELGIGRPSTYAPIIQTIVGRNYVERQSSALVPTELGFVVVDLLVKHFERLMDVGFTAEMESMLDEVEDGKAEWKSILRGFYSDFSVALDSAKTKIEPVRKKEELTDEKCDLCEKPMVIKWGRRGKFMSCSDFPKCRFSKSIPTSTACPKCTDGRLVSRRSKTGKGRAFYGCSRYPECDYISNKLPSASNEAQT